MTLWKNGLKGGNGMNDLISRQDAITLPVMPKEHREYQTYNLDDAYEQGWLDLQKCIEQLPSAQPVLTCDGCRHVGTYDTDFPCNGCVRREKDYYDPER